MTTKQKWAWGLAALAVIAIIYFWSDISKLWTSDEPVEGATERAKGKASFCPKLNGVPCCPPNVIRFNHDLNKNVCD